MAIIRPNKNRIKGRNRLGRFTSGADHTAVILRKDEPLSELVGRARKGKRRRRRIGTQVSIDIVSDDALIVSFPADVILEHWALAMLKHHHQAILSGQKADGSGPQPDLAQEPKGGRRSPHRGFKTGFFADTIRSTKITGSTRTARVKISPNRERGAFLAFEASRGVEYLYVSGDVERLTNVAISQAFDAGLEGDIRLTPEYGSGAEAKDI